MNYAFLHLSEYTYICIIISFRHVGRPPPFLLLQTQTKKTEHQKGVLMASFQSKPYLDFAEKHRLANMLNISERHVQYWFASTRAKKRNVRTCKRMTEDQKKILMEKFEEDPYLDPVRRKKLAMSMNTSESSITGWFMNARTGKQTMALYQAMTKDQQQILLDSFQANRYLIDAETCRLAKMLNTTRRVIKYWFVKTRIEERKKIRSFQRESTL